MAFSFNSPSADPLEGYDELPISPVFVDDDGDDMEDQFVECNWCSRRATMTSPEGWPICQSCADERAHSAI